MSSEREKMRQRGVPSSEQTDNVIYGLTAQEVYATYARGMDPAHLLEEGRTKIASRLMVKKGMTEEGAYFAADQILRVATEKIETR